MSIKLNKNLRVALDKVVEGEEAIDGDGRLMKLHVLVGRDLRSKLTVCEVEQTSCTIGVSWNYICKLDQVNRLEGKHPLYVTSQIPCWLRQDFEEGTEHSKAAKVFYTWLLNDSPYSKAFVLKDIEQVIQLGHFVVTTKLDHRIVAEALMCTRYCWEEWCKHFCILFSKLYQAGVSGNMAFQATYQIKLSSGAVRYESSMGGHCAPQSNMGCSNALRQFVCVGKPNKVDEESLVRLVKEKATWYHNSYTVDKGYGVAEAPYTFKNLGGFVSGEISKGWGKYGWYVTTYVKNFIEELATRGKSRGLFHKAWEYKYGDVIEVELNEDNLDKVVRFYNQLEKYLEDDVDPTVKIEEVA